MFWAFFVRFFDKEPFLGCSSCVSLVTAANFRLFLNVAIFEGKMLRSYEDWIILYLLINLRL